MLDFDLFTRVIDEVTFWIDGAIHENYARYRQRGDLETALGNLAAMADEKRPRAWLPRTLGPDESVKVAIDVPTPDTSGRYALKFDLVFEGVDWFENFRSETTTTSLLVW